MESVVRIANVVPDGITPGSTVLATTGPEGTVVVPVVLDVLVVAQPPARIAKAKSADNAPRRFPVCLIVRSFWSFVPRREGGERADPLIHLRARYPPRAGEQRA